MQKDFLFTSESVSEGHPDKIADQISDAVLDAMLEQDKKSRVACETFVKTGMVLVGGEVTTSAWVDIEQIVRNVVRDIGYNSSQMGFDWESCAVMSAIGKQSVDIAQGVDRKTSEEQGAGDQGLMFECQPLFSIRMNWSSAKLNYAKKTFYPGFVRMPKAKSLFAM